MRDVKGLREVYIIGVGQTKFTKQPDVSAVELSQAAVQAAIEDAGIDPRILQVAYAGQIEEASCTAQYAVKAFGVQEIECINVENACCTGGTAVRGLWKDIAYGVYDIGIAIGVESLSNSPINGKLVPMAKQSFSDLLGYTAMATMGEMAQWLIANRGATMEDLAMATYRNHKNAVFNPYAHYRRELTMEEILNSPMIVSPITTLMCCPMSDGAAAVIMCTKEIAMQYTTKLVQMRSCELGSARFMNFDTDHSGRQNIRPTAHRAYENAGVGPLELGVVELHDAYSPEELMVYDEMEMCEPGESVKLSRSGDLDMGGRCPVNPSGGLLSLGHPLGASGTRAVVDVVKQLRGNVVAPEIQVRNTRAGMAQMIGGGDGKRVGAEANFVSIITT